MSLIRMIRIGIFHGARRVLTYKKKTCFDVVTPFSTGSWSFDAIALVASLEMYAGSGLMRASALLVVWECEGATSCLFAQTCLLRARVECVLALEAIA